MKRINYEIIQGNCLEEIDKLYSTFIFMLPIFVLPIVFYLLIELAGIEGFLLNRLLTWVSSKIEKSSETKYFFFLLMNLEPRKVFI